MSNRSHGSRKFIDAVRLDDITLFRQDWGSLIGLSIVGDDPDRFPLIAVSLEEPEAFLQALDAFS